MNNEGGYRRARGEVGRARDEASTRAAGSPNVRNRGFEAPVARAVRPIQPSSTRPQLTRPAPRTEIERVSSRTLTSPKRCLNVLNILLHF